MSVAVVQALYDRFNERDLEGMADTVAEDFVLEDMALGLRFEGREGLMQWLQGFLTAMPDASTEVTLVVDGGEWIATEHTGRGTQTGPLVTPAGEIPPSGNGVELKFGEFFRIRDARIAHLRAYWDAATLLRQIGAA
jgi:steroid delta-isomerase-like uncharacterized protein